MRSESANRTNAWDPTATARVMHTSHTVCVSATFAADLINRYLRLWLLRLYAAGEVRLRPCEFGALVRELLDPDSPFAANSTTGLNVALIRLEDLGSQRPPADEASASFAALPPPGAAGGAAGGRAHALQTLARALSGYSRRAPLLVVRCRPSPTELALELAAATAGPAGSQPVGEPGGQHSCHAAAADVLLRAAAAAAHGGSVSYATWAQLEALAAAPLPPWLPALDSRYSRQGYYSPTGDALASQPFSKPFAAALATSLARRLVIVDCDNTLWGGAVSEEGPLGLELGGAYLALRPVLG
ncbi:hypothetical protein T492DRAFT_869151 [Pavlovales sp. CCMP2436]|nr:hypothetical protein T492DRAFT_869151 [Pavlovales sp. CCMP2436]